MNGDVKENMTKRIEEKTGISLNWAEMFYNDIQKLYYFLIIKGE